MNDEINHLPCTNILKIKPHLLVLLGECGHAVPVDVGTAASAQSILVKVEHSTAIHDRVPVYPDVLEVVGVGAELATQPRQRIRADDPSPAARQVVTGDGLGALGLCDLDWIFFFTITSYRLFLRSFFNGR